MNQKAFASQADLEEKPVSFVEMGPGAYAYTFSLSSINLSGAPAGAQK